MSEQSETDFDLASYRHLGECSAYCKEHYRPRGRHEPNCESDEVQELINEIDRLNLELKKAQQDRTDTEPLSDVGLLAHQADTDGQLTLYGMILHTLPPKGMEELGTVWWAMVPTPDIPTMGMFVVATTEEDAMKEGWRLSNEIATMTANLKLGD